MLALACTLLLASSEGYDPGWDGPEVDLSKPIDSMSLRQLQSEYTRVEAARPGIGGPIAAMSIGGGVFALGCLGLLGSAGSFGGVGAAFTERNPAGYFFASMLAIGAAFVLAGFWLLWNRREDRAVLGERLDTIRERLDYARERLEAPRPPREQRPGRIEPVPQL